MSASSKTASPNGRGNAAIFGLCLAFAGGMVGMSYAAVPLYRMFCAVTGFNGTTQRAEQASSVILDERIKVTFDANMAPGLDWTFKPDQYAVNPRIGETIEARFSATNRSDKPTKGQAVFNVTPMEAAAYFNKIECFCFTETELKPGETLDMPVVFYIDPEITKQAETKSIGTITLSYTFYPHEGDQPVAQLPVETRDSARKL